MTETSYYVYALKDPRSNPARPFYIGKGTGTRAYDHVASPDDTRKGLLIREIEAAGCRVVITKILDGLSELQALRIEAELIAGFGTVDSGGILYNSIVPVGLAMKSSRHVVVPFGAKEKAQLGLSLLKDAVLEFAQANSPGITNGEAASHLGLRSDYGGGSKDYLSYSILGILMGEGRIRREERSRRHIATVR